MKSVRFIRSSDGQILLEYYDGPQEEFPTYNVELQVMPDGNLRRTREWID